MTTGAYRNSQYWQAIHEELTGTLQSVGHPNLCESFNRLKYISETETYLQRLDNILAAMAMGGKESLSLLDAGAGTGYWTGLAHARIRNRCDRVRTMALDISRDALRLIHARYPRFDTVRQDLKKIDTDIFSGQFDLVQAIYCVHHIVEIENYINALLFLARSVREGGFLMIMDPVLQKPYSRFHALDFSSFDWNGIPRPLHLMDDVLCSEGFSRLSVEPAVSFILNGSIEGFGRLDHFITNWLWRGMNAVAKREKATTFFSTAIAALDRFLKRKNLSFSSSLCVYRKSGGGGRK